MASEREAEWFEEEEMEGDLISPSLLQETEDILTQPCQKPLEGVVVFVDVRSGSKNTINTGNSLEDSLTNLGATVLNKLHKDVTHIIFKDGKINLDRVNKSEVFIVSPLWLDACNRCNERVSEAKYPVILEGTESPVVLGRVKRMRSMQPKPFEEDEIARSVERKKKKGTSSIKKTPLAIFDFTTDDDELQIIDQSDDSRCSTPDSLPPVSFTRTPTTGKVKNTKPFTEKNDTPKTETAADKKTTKKRTINEEKVTKKKNDKMMKKCKEKKKERKAEKEKEEEKEGVAGNEDNFVSVKMFRRKRSSFEKKPTIVMTSVPTKDQCVVHVIVDKLGGFDLEHNVSERTTHVVCGTVRRTINVLAGTVKGCWILSMDWVLKSLEADHWLPEGPFELITDFPSAQFFRLERQMAGPLYRPTLFNKTGSIYISNDTKPSHSDIELLLQLAGAKITTSKLKADIVIGGGEGTEGKVHVKESWILESITKHTLQPIEEYVI